jgi:hypothetical protein
LWGTGIAAAASVADIQQFSVLAILSGGMVGASVLTYSTMAIAAMMFMAPICLGTVVAWALFPGAQLWIGALFCTSYLLILSRGAFQSQREFARPITREELREAGATVQLLLNDFEAQSADWLWKVDADGRIIDPSPRFGDAARRAWQLLENEPLTGLFEPCRETDIDPSGPADAVSGFDIAIDPGRIAALVDTFGPAVAGGCAASRAMSLPKNAPKPCQSHGPL